MINMKGNPRVEWIGVDEIQETDIQRGKSRLMGLLVAFMFGAVCGITITLIMVLSERHTPSKEQAQVDSTKTVANE